MTTVPRKSGFQKTHGDHGSPESKAWKAMRQRCRNPRCREWRFYGGRGIDICPEWEDYSRFLADMGRRPSPKHSLDRIDNALGYAPGNCQWASDKQQCRNRRSNKLVTVGAETLSLAEWSERSGIPYSTLMFRIRSGWEPQRALTTPVDHQAGRFTTDPQCVARLARHKRPNKSA